jgi:Ribonuclease G/E
VTAEGHVLSEHTTATEAESAAQARLREDGHLVVVDRYDRCHRRE